MKTALAFLLDLLGALLGRALSVEQAATANHDLGAQEAANATGKIIADIADKRASLPRGSDSPADLANRLHARAARLRSADGK